MEVGKMMFTEGFTGTLARTLDARITDAEEDARRLWRILDPEQRIPGANPSYPLNGNWLNVVEQAATAALIQVSAFQGLLIMIRDEAAKARKEANTSG
jgi:hypothetical protein